MNKIEKCEKALKKLNSFLLEKTHSEVVKAGIIQAFEYTFEIFWKTFQSFALEQGFAEITSPRKSLIAAFHLKIIDDQQIWVHMMQDRNNASHTYNEEIADEIYQRVKLQYKDEFESALRNMKNFTR